MLRRRLAGLGTPVGGRSPMTLMNRCTRFRLATIPSRSYQALMRRDP